MWGAHVSLQRITLKRWKGDGWCQNINTISFVVHNFIYSHFFQVLEGPFLDHNMLFLQNETLKLGRYGNWKTSLQSLLIRPYFRIYNSVFSLGEIDPVWMGKLVHSKRFQFSSFGFTWNRYQHGRFRTTSGDSLQINLDGSTPSVDIWTLK